MAKLARTWIAAPPIRQRQGCGPRVLALLLRLLRRCAGCPGPPPPILTPGCFVVGRNRVTAAVSVTSWGWLLRGGPPAGDQRGVRVLRAGGLGTERIGPTAGTAETPMHLRETPVHSGNASVCGR